MNSILEILIIFHLLIWIFIIFGGIISSDICKFIVFIMIPFIYVLHILPFHIIVEAKLRIIEKEKSTDLENKSSTDILFEIENRNIIINLFNKLKTALNFSLLHPLSAQGLLILGYIINIYLLKYVYNEIK
jgi:hypothetical protein